MKKTFIYMISLLLLGLTGCDEDFNKDVAPPQSTEQEEAKNTDFQVALAPGLSSPVDLNDLASDAVIQAVTVTTSPTLNEGATLSFATQVSKTENFAEYIDLPVSSEDKTATVTVAVLDEVVKEMFGVAQKANPFYIRTFIYIHEGSSAVRSAAYTIGPATVTPVATEVAPFLYVPGNHQNWSPATAPTLYTSNMDLIYDGFVYLDGEYKLTTAPDWDHTAYGDGGDGKLSTDGGNLNAEAGFYYLKADLNSLTYEQTKTEWGIIGDATPGGWDNSTPMTYNRENNTWTVTANLEGGKSYKFRANEGWDINLGGAPNKLTFGGDNILLETSGNYTIVLKLSNADSGYTFTITKN